MSNNIIDIKDFDINKINLLPVNNKNLKNQVKYINLSYDYDYIPLINLGNFKVNDNKKQIIFKFNNLFHSTGSLDKNRYKLYLYKDMFPNNDIIDFSNKLYYFINNNIKNINEKFQKNIDMKHCHIHSFYNNDDDDNNDLSKYNRLNLSLPRNKDGCFTDEFKVYKKIKDNNIVEIENINNIDDLYNLLNIRKNNYSKLILTPFVRIKYIYVSSHLIGFKINLEKLIIDTENGDFITNYYNKYNITNKTTDKNILDNYIDSTLDKSDYPNDFNNIFNIKLKSKSNNDEKINDENNNDINNINNIEYMLSEENINKLIDLIYDKKDNNININITPTTFYVKINKQ